MTNTLTRKELYQVCSYGGPYSLGATLVQLVEVTMIDWYVFLLEHMSYLIVEYNYASVIPNTIIKSCVYKIYTPCMIHH